VTADSSSPVVAVTGGGSGIGAGIAAVLAERGWRVVVVDRDRSGAEEVAERIGGAALPADVTGPAAALVDDVVGRYGRLDGLVNNAGVIRRHPLAEPVDADLDGTWAVNVGAIARLSAAALPHLAATQGAVVNLASMAARVPQLGGGIYSASKAAVVALTQQSAVEWGPLGVRVNAVGPGMIRTAMAEAVYADADLHERRRRMVPLGRIGLPEDIGRVVAFLLSPDAGYVTGQHIVVDGGLSDTLVRYIPQP